MGWFKNIVEKAKSTAGNIADIAKQASNSIINGVKEAGDLYSFITDGGIDTEGRSNNTTIEDINKTISSTEKQEPIIANTLSQTENKLNTKTSNIKNIDTLVIVAPATLAPGTRQMSQKVSFRPAILPELLSNPQVIKVLGLNKSILEKITPHNSLVKLNDKALTPIAKQLGFKSNKEGRFILTITGTAKQIESALGIFSQVSAATTNRIMNSESLTQEHKTAAIKGNNVNTKILNTVLKPTLPKEIVQHEADQPIAKQRKSNKNIERDKSKPWYVKAYNWVRDKVKRWIIEPLKNISKSTPNQKEDNLLYSRPQEGLLDYEKLISKAQTNEPYHLSETPTRAATAEEEKENKKLRDTNMSFADLHSFMSPMFEEEQVKKSAQPNKKDKLEARIDQNIATKQAKSVKEPNSKRKSNKQPSTSSRGTLSEELKKEARRAARSARRSAKSANKIDIKGHDKEIYKIHNTGFHTGKGPGHRR